MDFRNKELFHEVDLIAEDKLNKTINDIAYMFQECIGASTGDITPIQQAYIDSIKAKLLGMIGDVAIQNSNYKDKDEFNDFAYLDIISSWTNDDETSVSAMVSDSGDHIFTYMYYDNVKFADGINIITGDSWKEIFNMHYKDAILEYLHDVKHEDYEQSYFNDDEMQILSLLYKEKYSCDFNGDNDIKYTKTTIQDSLNNNLGIVLFNKNIPVNNIIDLIHSVKPKCKIFTIENPIVESNYNAVQIQINYDCDLNYPNAIKQVLRHEPDYIVIDDVRFSRDTANLITQSAKLGNFLFVGIDETNKENAEACFRSLMNESNSIDINDYLIDYVGNNFNVENEISTDKEL